MNRWQHRLFVCVCVRWLKLGTTGNERRLVVVDDDNFLKEDYYCLVNGERKSCLLSRRPTGAVVLGS